MLKPTGEKHHIRLRRRQFGQDQTNTRAIGRELLSKGTQVIDLVPAEFIQVEHKAALAPFQRIADSLAQTRGIRG